MIAIARPILQWLAAAASFISLLIVFLPSHSTWAPWQTVCLISAVIVFLLAGISEVRENIRRSAKSFNTDAEINQYMFRILSKGGRCEICSRDASWITNAKIYTLLKEKAKQGELTFLVHSSSNAVELLQNIGAEVIEYGKFGFDPVARFTVVNAGNLPSSYVAVGRRVLNGPHIIEELDSSHPTYSMATDIVTFIRAANAQV